MPSTPETIYLWIVAVATASLLIADIVGVKGFHVTLGPLDIVHTCGMLTFPITFLLTDLVTDYYGRAATRRMTFVSAAMAAFAFAVMNVAQAMPRVDAPWNVPEEAFDTIFGSAKAMYVASLAAYLVGQLVDVTVFMAAKRLTGGRYIWLRATGSTIVSQLFDSLVVSTLYLEASAVQRGVVVGPAEILKFAASGYGLKFALAIAVTPLIYAGHALLQGRGLHPLPPDAQG